VLGASGSAIVCSGTLACFVAVVGGGFAQAQAEGAVPVTFDVQVVHGSNDEEAVADPRCDQIRQNLPIPFKSLAEVQRKQLNVSLGQAGSLKLPSGRQIRLIPITIIDNRLHVLLKMEGLVESQLRLSSGRAVIVGGEPFQNGRIIIKLTPSFRTPPVIAVTPTLRQGLQPSTEPTTDRESKLPEVEKVGHPRPR